ncbi:MAG: MFS transporter [Thermodesulfobacteriota bacterium]
MNKQERKIFGTLFFSIFAAVTGVGIVVPLLPVYAHGLGAGGLYIGLIFGAFSLSRTVFMPYFGRLSDKKGRKPYIVAGLMAYALISIAFIFSTGIKTLIVIRFFQGIASAMIMPITQAYIGDITPPGREGFSMGLFNMSVFCGLSIGPLAGGMINDHFSLSTAFTAMGILALIGFFSSLVLLPPVLSEPAMRCSKKPSGWKRLLKDRNIAGFFSFRLAYTICIGIIWGFLPVFAAAEFSLSSSAIGILVMLGVLISGLIHTPMGFLADKINRRMIVLAGGLITGFAVLSFAWAGGFSDLFLASVLFGIGGGVSMPALMALAVLKGSRANAMGSVMALLTMAHSLGMLVGSLLGGLTMDIFSLRLAFGLGSAAMVAGTVLFMFCTAPKKMPWKM